MLEQSVDTFDGVGKVQSSRLRKLGIHTIYDLLFYFPTRYEDLSKVSKIDQLVEGEVYTILVRIDLIQTKRSPRKKMYITECLASDETGSLNVVWFNQPFIGKALKPGDVVYLSGKVGSQYQSLVMQSPLYEKYKRGNKESLHSARIVPIYGLTKGITSKQLRLLVKKSLSGARELVEWLPPQLLNAEKLMPLQQALHEIHFPSSQELLEAAIKRLKFDELFTLQLFTQKLRAKNRQQQSHEVKFFDTEIKEFVGNLPFTLTYAQRKAAWDILQDMTAEQGAMNRLLEGDVGSGKTVVAAIVMLNMALNQKMSAIMAPTEILAAQHFQSFTKFYASKDISVALLTRANCQYQDCHLGEAMKMKKKEVIQKVNEGKVDILIGTHALLQDSVDLERLGLVIIDEQHRFGVKQRDLLKDKGLAEHGIPHFLSMTATPIPRSLALAMYGDLDLSVLDEMPAGRKPVITKYVDIFSRQNAYEFIREQIAQGRQAYVICPLVAESDKLGAKSVEQEYIRLNEDIFPELEIGKLHGKLKKDEKQMVMDAFAAGELQILVSTSVIEVGVNVPNASVMLIEGADRFGLAQLHQFRGRVGRAEHQSYCFVFASDDTQEANERLQLFCSTNDGFDLAQRDLELRGPGEVYGLRQSGMIDFKLARVSDVGLIKKTREYAQAVVAKDPVLQNYPLLAARIEHFDELHGME